MSSQAKNKTVSAPPALFQDGLRYHEAGQLDQAIKAYQRVIKAHPRYAPVLHNMAIALWQQGQTRKALSYARKALTRDPANAGAHNTLGLIWTSLSSYENAEKSFAQALQYKPDYAEAYFNLARLFFVSSQWKKAQAAAESLLVLQPNHVLGQIIKIAALAEQGSFQDFDGAEDRVFARMPESAFAYYLKGRVNFLAGHIDKALDDYDRALVLEPEHLLTLHAKAAALIEHDDKEDARICLMKILDLEPDHVLALKLLASIHKFTEDDDVYKKLKAIDVKKGNFPAKEKAELYYARAKYFADTGNTEKTFSHWQRGAAEKFSTFDYDFAQKQRAVDNIKAAFSPDVPAIDSAQQDTVPLFIIGMPRSGTTLTEQILASHSDIAAGGELIFLRQALTPLEQHKNPGEAAEQYMKWLKGRVPDAGYVTDKMPYNYLYTGFIRQILPQAKIIHMMRNPLDTCLSCFSIIFHSGHEWSYDLRELGRYYRLYDEMMDFWREKLPENSFIDVRYEELVSDQENKTKEILAYCGLPWDDSCLAFHENKRAVRTASTQQVRKPLYTSSIERWREYEQYLTPLIEELAPVMKKHNYPL